MSARASSLSADSMLFMSLSETPQFLRRMYSRMRADCLKP